MARRGARSSASCPSGSARSSGPRASSASRRRRRRTSSRRYPETAPRVRVAQQRRRPAFFRPADDPAAPAADPPALRRAGGRYILYLGTLEPRKNVEALVVACERMWGRRRSRPDLVLAGGAGWKTAGLHRRIARSPFRDKIHVAGYTAREAARELYRAAEVFVYPSLAEGFGLPVLEAMACGTPVVASTADALVEVGGDAALYAPAARRRGALARRSSGRSRTKTLRRRCRAAGPARAAAVPLGGRGAGRPPPRSPRPPGSTREPRPGRRGSGSTRASSRTSGSAPTSATSSRRSPGAPRRSSTASASTSRAPTATRCRRCPPTSRSSRRTRPATRSRS